MLETLKLWLIAVFLTKWQRVTMVWTICKLLNRVALMFFIYKLGIGVRMATKVQFLHSHNLMITNFISAEIALDLLTGTQQHTYET